MWLVLARGLEWRISTVRIPLRLMELLAIGRRPATATIICSLPPRSFARPIDRQGLLIQMDCMLQATRIAVTDIEQLISDTRLAQFIHAYAQTNPGNSEESFAQILAPKVRQVDVPASSEEEDTVTKKQRSGY
jgi:hypothetical protein